MKYRFLAVPLLAAATVFAQSQAAPATPSTPNRDPGARRVAMLTRMLSLTTDQQTQVQSLLEAERTGSQAAAEQLKTLRTSLITAAKNNDVGGINSITQQMQAPRQQLDVLRVTTAAKIYALLNPDQKTKADHLIEMLMAGGGPGGPRFGGHPGGPPRGGAR